MSDDLDEGNVGQPSESEVEASTFGWVPKEQFHGNPDEWKDADTFLKRGKEINGFLRNDLEKIKRAHAAEVAELRQTMTEFQKYHDETEARAYIRAFNDLKKAKIEAIEQGDGARVIDLEDQITSLKELQKDKPAAQPKNDVKFTPQELNEWRTNNNWYGKDQELSELTDDFAELTAKKNPELKGIDFLNAVTKKVKAVRPDAFENPNRNNATVSGSGGARPSDKKGKTYSDLPAEAKAACDKFVKQGMLTKEKYVSEYFLGE